jgi:hypothetical protein
MPQRYDFQSVNVASRTPEGFIIDTPIVGRIGIQEYMNADGSVRRELRLPQHVFDVEALSSMEGKPITVDHPKVGAVTPDNVAALAIGTVLTPGQKADNDQNVRAKIVIHKADSIGERRQLSLGYQVELQETPGEWQGQKYDAVQTNIRVNHLSVVARGRAGVARLNIDGDESEIEVHQPEKRTMPKIKLDTGIEYEAPAEVIAHAEKLKRDADEAKSQVTTLTAKVDTVTAERDGLKAKVDAHPAALEQAKKDALEAGRKSAAARAELEAVAKKFDVKTDGVSDKEIKVAVIVKANPKFDAKDKSDAYVDAAFDMAKESKADAAMAQQRAAGTGGAPAAGSQQGSGTPAANADEDSRSAYERHMDELQNGPAKKD